MRVAIVCVSRTELRIDEETASLRVARSLISSSNALAKLSSSDIVKRSITSFPEYRDLAAAAPYLCRH
jgi:hypothetical protein